MKTGLKLLVAAPPNRYNKDRLCKLSQISEFGCLPKLLVLLLLQPNYFILIPSITVGAMYLALPFFPLSFILISIISKRFYNIYLQQLQQLQPAP
jgi:hypothetical protein